MTRLFILLLSCLLPTLGSAAEVTLLYGTQDGGRFEHIDSNTTLDIAADSVWGMIIGTPLNRKQELELLYTRQRTRLQESGKTVPVEELIALDVHYLHLGGTVLSDPYSGWQGFLSGGLGLTHFNPTFSELDSETRPSMSLGLGARWMPSQRVGLRLETRLYGTLFNSQTSVFCGGGCVITVSGNLLTQYSLLAGLVFRF